MKANPQTSPNETNRTVLMVDGHGRIRTIHKFHQKLVIGIALVVFALVAAAVAFWMYAGGLQVQAELREQIDALRDQVAEAEHQQELLLARAVKAEARVASGDPQEASSAAAPAASPVVKTRAKNKRPTPQSGAATTPHGLPLTVPQNDAGYCNLQLVLTQLRFRFNHPRRQNFLDNYFTVHH